MNLPLAAALLAAAAGAQAQNNPAGGTPVSEGKIEQVEVTPPRTLPTPRMKPAPEDVPEIPLNLSPVGPGTDEREPQNLEITEDGISATSPSNGTVQAFNTMDLVAGQDAAGTAPIAKTGPVVDKKGPPKDGGQGAGDIALAKLGLGGKPSHVVNTNAAEPSGETAPAASAFSGGDAYAAGEALGAAGAAMETAINDNPAITRKLLEPTAEVKETAQATGRTPGDCLFDGTCGQAP